MTSSLRALFACIVVAVFALAGWSANAKNMPKHNAKVGCRNLVFQIHPDLKRKEKRAEIRKCNDDPEGYNKSSGIAM